MRASSYNIYVKLESDPNFYFMVQGYTGAIDLIRTSTILLLRKANCDSSEFLGKIDSNTIELLKERGYLTNKTKEEEKLHVQNISEIIQDKEKNNFNSFLFVVTQNCNFRCPYCYENEISNYGNKWEKSVFTKDMVDKAFKTMHEIQPERKRIQNFIGLYGGEPLLKENYEIVRYIVEKGQKEGFTFRATTNGYDLDHFSDLLGPGLIERLHITIDGLKETNNKRRKHHENKDTFSKIMNNFSLALEKGAYVQNRINIDESNFNEIEELMQHYKAKGFFDNKKFMSYLGRIVDHEKESNKYSNEISHADFIDRGKRLMNLNSDDNKFQIHDYNVKIRIKDIIENNTLFAPNTNYCGSNKGMFVLDPSGSIFTCWEKIGIKNHMVGTFNNGLQFNEKVLGAWHNRTIGNIEQCSKCKYALWCGGGCGGLLKIQDDININKSNCMDYPTIFSKVINEYYDDELKNKFIEV